MVLRVGIKVSLAACNGRHHALVFQAQFPPGFVVTLGIDLAGKNFPTPLINQQTKRQECHAIQCLFQQNRNVSFRRRHFVEQANLLQILRRVRQCDGVANRFVEAVVGPVLEKERLALVSALIEIVSQFVMDG